MKILAAGGGSGGHVTPVVAVLRELKKRDPDCEVRFWCDRKFSSQAKDIMNNFDKSIPVETIISGKFRRYTGVSWLRQLTHLPIVLPNIRDGFKVLTGYIQSLVKLILWRPDVVFSKGGYVCLPIGLAARTLRIPLVIHDSDAHPGLTNRVLSKWANKIGTGAPLKFYPYSDQKARYVGIPISSNFHPYTADEQLTAKRSLGVSDAKPLIVITGGGLGAQRINEAVSAVLSDLRQVASVILISGSAQYEKLRSILPPDSEDFQLHAFVSDNMATMLAAADIVVTRAGATTILELAALEKPTILIPNAFLTGGHQLKNAQVYAEKDAVVWIDETALEKSPQILTTEIQALLADEDKRQAMSRAFSTFARPDAASDMTDMIIETAKR